MKKILFTLPPVMGLIFNLTFVSLGPYLSTLLAEGISWWTNRFAYALDCFQIIAPLKGLLLDGICTGMGSVLAFLPIIAVLFFNLSLAETSGYLLLAAHAMDKPLQKLGLSGESVVPLLTGFGCSVPAIMSASSLKNKTSRLPTVTAIPFFSCSARLPIYTAIAGALFNKRAPFVILFLYIIGIAAGLLSCLLFKKKFVKSDCPSMSPHLRIPSVKNATLAAFSGIKDFSRKIFTVIFIGSMVIWFLENFNCQLEFSADTNSSILANLGRLAAPIFEPLGFDDWRAVSALIAGLTAKEAVVSTLAVLTSTTSTGAAANALLSEIFTPISGFGYMLFCLLYVPCLGTLAAIYKEFGSVKIVLFTLIFHLGIAWFCSFLLWQFGLLLN